MKKKSILLLLLVCLLSLVMGVVGCDIYSPVSSESETESELESESESIVAEVLDAEIYADIVAANSGAAIMEGAEEARITYSFVDGDLAGHSAVYVFYKVEDAYHAVYSLEAEEVVSTSLIEEDASYTLRADGTYVYGIYPGEDNVGHALSYGFLDFDGYKVTGDVVKAGDTISFTVELKDKDADTLTQIVCQADSETLVIYEANLVCYNDEDDSVIEAVDMTFETGSDFDIPVEASELEDIKAHVFGEENDAKIEFQLVLNPEGESVTRQYAVAEGVKIVMDCDSERNPYSFYKNLKCTKDIEDLAEILVDYNGATVYAAITGPQFSFDFTLTEADIEQMNSYIELYLQLAETSPSFDEIENQRAYIEDMMGYFVHQYYMGQIQYYLDVSKQSGKDALNFAQETYNDMYEAYIAMYRTVYEMQDNEYSEWLFADWTEEDLAILYQDNESISNLESANTQLEQEFNDLPNDADWSSAVEGLYEQFVANNQQIAALHGYDNAYDYMAKEHYNRTYSDEERAAFFSNAKKYVNGFYNKASTMWDAVNAGIDQELYQRYNLVANKSTKSLSNEYISGYINSYNNSLNQKMKDMYEKKAVKFSLSSKAQQTAFVNYSNYYEEGFAFFGNGMQDLLTVIHEMGHYVANSSYSLGSMGYDLAETHSQGNEWMMLYYLKDKIDVDVFEVMYSLRLVNSMYAVLYATIVDEFEYRVYTAETPYKVGEYRAVFDGVLADLGVTADADSIYAYVQQVSLLSPVYYLNYATSEITSIGFYTMAEEQGYEVAQEAYRKLQEDCDITLSYAEIIEELGLRGPFEEATYRSIDQVFFAD